MTEKEEFDSVYEILNPKVISNTEIVEASKQKLPFMIHITKEHTAKPYVPRIGMNQAKTEDRTLPRVTCADTLLGCMIGYARIESEFFNVDNEPELREIHKTGYRINRLDYKYCLKPNSRLVFDAIATNEHWLIAYTKETHFYKPLLAGYLFIQSIKVTQNAKNVDPDSEIEIYIDVRDKEGFYLTKKIYLSQGYHRALILYNRHVTFDNEKHVKHFKIDKKEFTERTQYKPSFENITLPNFLKW